MCDLSMLSTVQAKSFWPALYLYTNKRIKLQKKKFPNARSIIHYEKKNKYVRYMI